MAYSAYTIQHDARNAIAACMVAPSHKFYDARHSLTHELLIGCIDAPQFIPSGSTYWCDDSQFVATTIIIRDDCNGGFDS